MFTSMHLLASGPAWRVEDVVCSAGPHDRPFEEQHDLVCVAAVTRVLLSPRTPDGRANLVPGALMLGNPEELRYTVNADCTMTQTTTTATSTSGPPTFLV